MSEVTASGSEAAETNATGLVAEVPAQSPLSAGELLRQAREAAGVDLASLAVALKVSVKKLEALESDHLDQLPDAVFVRALASSVCRALKINAAPVLAKLPQTVAPRLQYDESGLNTPFHTPGDVAKTPFWDRLSRPMVLAALTVVIGALVLIFFPSTEQREEIGAIVARAPAPAPEQVVPEVVPSASQNESVAAKAAAPVAMTPAKAAPATTQRAAPETPAPAVTTVPAAIVSETTPPVRKKLSSTGIVVFKTSGPSWIEVTDARGAVQLSRMIEPGEPVGASGPKPLSVTIGRADVTEVQVRGQPYPLESVTKQGVARFEVK